MLGRPPGDPLVRASTRAAFVLYARYWFDSFHVVGETDEAMIERFTVVDAHHLFDPLEAGTGVIVAMPHVGDWDAAGRWLLAEGHRCVSVAEQLEPRRLFELFVDHRSQLGMDILGLSSATVGRQLATALANNRVVSLVSDRDLTGRNSSLRDDEPIGHAEPRREVGQGSEFGRGQWPTGELVKVRPQLDVRGVLASYIESPLGGALDDPFRPDDGAHEDLDPHE